MIKLDEWNGYWNKKFRYDNYDGNRSLVEAVKYGAKCHDYVEAKAVSLKGAGIPYEDMMVGIGLDKVTGLAHSVLIVGGKVLDNRDGYRDVYDDDGDNEMVAMSRIPYTTFLKGRKK